MLLNPKPGIYTIPFEAGAILAAISGRQFNNEHRNDFLAHFGFQESELFRVHQTHSALIRVVDQSSSPEDKPEGDALLTNQKGKLLGILTADCFPVFLYDPDHEAIGLVHAGWRGLAGKIVSAGIHGMTQEFESVAAHLKVIIGPAIRHCCFEVGEEMEKIFPEAYRVPAGKIKAHVDLTQVLRKELCDSGVLDKNVWDCGICTVCQNNEFFSARKEKGSKERILSILCLQ